MAADINFYGLLYEFHRTSTNGADILITIEKKWYEGEVKQRALGRAPVIKRENKDHIFGTSCELYAECLVDGEYADMYTSDPYEFRVSVYKDETLLWQGFVSPELYSEPDAAPPYDVQITATDGLGELKNSIYEERGAASILSHIMGLIGQYPIYVISGLRYVDSTGAISQDHDILNVRINLDHEKGNSKYDVLQNLLTSLNANITQLNGRYVIFRETDFINKATDEGVEAFDVNGEKVYISIASFGSMTSHQWWPIGQLSTVVEPAKNSLLLQAPNHYKDNVLDFSQWSILNSAEYDAAEDAYILPDEGSYITQALDFDNEVGYRLGLRIRARNVGDSEEDQNIGLMIKVNARTYAAPEGRDFWLVKSEVSTGNARTDYLWRGQEDYFEEALNMPSDADTASDAQNVDIVIPLYDHSQNGLSYIFASSLSIKIFNPAGIHDIYVYDVSLVKYEQSEGYEAKVVINNAAREAESDIDLSMSSASFAPAAGNMFMTGLPMQADGLLIEQWQIPGSAAQEYLSAMSYDYARAVALPKMKYSGVLNVPDTATILPILFLRDGTYYFPKTYTYDLYNDEIQVELISISAADVSLSSVVISQYAESSGNMGGVTTGGGGGGSVISLPRDKVMSDTSDNAVENKVIKKYVDDLRDQLLDLWHLDENGNIVTDKQVLIKNNLIVEKDTSSGGEGEDTPAEGTVTGIEVNGTPYGPNTQGVIDLSAAFNAIDVSDQLEDYYTKTQTDSAISTAIAAIDLSIYAKSEDVYTKTQIDEIEEGIDTALATKAKQSDLVTLQGEVDNIETVLGLSETAEGYINTWAEVVAFLDGYKNADDLATILSGINADIAKNAEDIATLDNDKADKTTVTALAERVSVNEGAIDALDKRVAAEEAVTTTYASWWADLKKWVTVEGDNVKISTNLIVTGDTSSGGSGQDTPASGTVTGIKVSASDTLYPNTAGVIDMVNTLASIDVSDQLKDYALKTDIPSLDGYAKLSDIPTIYTLTLKKADGSTLVAFDPEEENKAVTLDKAVVGLGNVDNKSSATIRGEITSANVTNALGYTPANSASLANYLPLSGGTISGSGFAPLSINRTSASGLGILLKSADANKASLSWDSSLGTYIYNYASAKTMGIKEDGTPYYDSYTLIHTGNIRSYKAGDSALFDGHTSDAYYRSELGAIPSSGNIAAIATGSWWNAEAKGTTNPLPTTYASLIAFGKSYYSPQLCVVHDATRAWLRGVYNKAEGFSASEWHELAFTDSNVASATKLQTARTIWGQSFDGTGDVAGNAIFGYESGCDIYFKRTSGYNYLHAAHSFALTVGNSTSNIAFSLESNKSAKFYGAVTMSNELFLGNNMGIYFKNVSGTNVLAMYVSPSNVLQVGYNNVDSVAFQKPVTINGTVTLPVNYQIQWGTTGYMIYGMASRIQVDAPLQVSGATTVSSTLSVGGNCYLSGMSMIYQSDNAYRLTSFTSENYARIYNIKEDGSSYGSMYIGQNSTGAIVILNGSYVGIGTTPSGNYKFQVSGNSYLGGSLHVSTTIKAVTSVTTPLLKSEGGLDIVANNSAAGSRLYLTANVFRPWGDDAGLIDLGASSTRWRSVYSVGGNFSGAVSIGNTLTVTAGGAKVTGDTTINGNLVVSGDVAST